MEQGLFIFKIAFKEIKYSSEDKVINLLSFFSLQFFSHNYCLFCFLLIFKNQTF
jgi:hypothetical protein